MTTFVCTYLIALARKNLVQVFITEWDVPLINYLSGLLRNTASVD